MSVNPENPPLVLVDRVAKSYPVRQPQGMSRVHALDCASFTIMPGERVALAGPSGSGKTTLLYLLAGVLQPDQGSISIDGRPLSRLRPGKELSRLVGVVHQQYDLVPQLPVIHNVVAGRLGQWSLFRSMVSLVWPQERHLVESALAQLGIADKIHERTSHLSGGEQQRVAIARIMAQDPRLVLADEPVASLDPSRADEMLRLLTDLTSAGGNARAAPANGHGSGQALVASLHSPYLIRKYFSRVIGLRQGRLQFDMPASELTEPVLERLYDLNHRSQGVPAAAEIP